MGKIVGTAPSVISGSVGMYTYRQTKDGTIVSEKVKAKGVSKRTLKQAMAQLQLANLQHLFNSFYGALEGGFENIPQRQNTRAAFMKANVGALPVYLTKQACNFGACVAAPVQITRGSLATIGVVREATPRTNVSLGELVIDANTTIAAFSRAIIDNNPGYQNGDQLSYFSVIQGTQAFGDYNGIPMVTTNRYEVTLDIHDNEHKLYDFVARYGFASVANGGTQYLGCSGVPAVGCFAWVHSRGAGAEMRVSTQFLENNNAEVLSAWTGDEALDKAAESYGGYVGSRFFEPGQTSSSVNVEEGSDVQTGAVFSGNFTVEDADYGIEINNSTVNRVELGPGNSNKDVVLFGTNMTSFDQPVKLRMYTTSNGNSYVDVDVVKTPETTTNSNWVGIASGTPEGYTWLGAVLVNGVAVKTFAPVGGTTGGGGDDDGRLDG